MEEKTLHLLILEDSPDDAELAVRELEREGFVVEWTRVDTEKGFREALAEKPDMILADYALPSFDGMSALHVHRQLAPEIPVIVFSGTIGEEVAVRCVKHGATDYVLKDNISRLGRVVKRALEEAESRRERKRMHERIRHLNSVLKAIRHINQLIVKEKER
ncbi:MAG: response regulator, partial [Deltaproteobacteria bacterium]|nr:response regulator [Deltaproteobacteria bacterium]